MAFTRKSHLYLTAATTMFAGAFGMSSTASAQEFYLGELYKLPYTFCPRGTVEADGRQLSIAQNTALFALFGTTYGGNGQTTFAVPDMRGRYSMHVGTGVGLTPRVQGETGGAETTTLTEAQMPRHRHSGIVRTTSAAANSKQPFRAIFATTPNNKYASGVAPSAQLMNRETLLIRSTGGAVPYDHRSPYLAIRYCVATEGIFPSRN